MRFKLEGTKPLDWDVEKDGAREIRYGDSYSKDSYDYLFEDDEFYKYLAEIQSIDDDDRAALDAARQPSDGIARAIAESEMTDEEFMALWGKENLGKYTINTPSADKQKESIASEGLEIFDKKEFQKSLEDFNKSVGDGPIKKATNAEIEKIIKQMELDW